MKGIGGRIRKIGKGMQEWVQRLKYREKVAVICFLTGLFPLTVMGYSRLPPSKIISLR